MKKIAILLGASGLTGSYLLDLLLKSDEYEKVKIFVRKKLDISHVKLTQVVCDLFRLEKYENDFFADEVYCCIGTTKAKTPDKKEYFSIDFNIPVSIAKLCEKNSIPTYSVISAINANKNSLFFYSRTKGEMEEAILGYNIKNIFLYRPSLIYGKREDNRLGERFGIIIFKAFGSFIKKDYVPIHAKNLAKAMILGSNTHQGKKIVFLGENNGKKFQ